MDKISIGNVLLGERPLISAPLTDISIDSLDSINGADLIELRIDMFSDLSLTHIMNTFNRTRERFNVPVIATCRSSREGGAAEISDKRRKKILETIITTADAIDIEIQSKIASSIISHARDHKKTAIASYHNFTETPSLAKLNEIYREGRQPGADIIKIAVMARTSDDLRVITELTLRYHNDAFITIAMGEVGMSTRIFFPMIGSLITYASLETKTAPGQLSITEVKRFLHGTVQ